MWNSTLGEFLTIVDGCRARERSRNWFMALGICAASQSGDMDPWTLLGEAKPPAADPLDVTGWNDSVDAQKAKRTRAYEHAMREQRRLAERAHRAWLPSGIPSPVERTIDEEEEGL